MSTCVTAVVNKEKVAFRIGDHVIWNSEPQDPAGAALSGWIANFETTVNKVTLVFVSLIQNDFGGPFYVVNLEALNHVQERKHNLESKNPGKTKLPMCKRPGCDLLARPSGVGLCTLCELGQNGLKEKREHDEKCDPRKPGLIGRGEKVNHPQHYGGDTPHETIKCLTAWGLLHDALLFNVVKYVSRAGKKGDILEDCKKAAWYLNRKISNIENAKGLVPSEREDRS